MEVLIVLRMMKIVVVEGDGVEVKTMKSLKKIQVSNL